MTAQELTKLITWFLAIAWPLMSGSQQIGAQQVELPDTPSGLAEPAQQLVSLAGRFVIVWGDPQPGSGDQPSAIYLLIDEAGQSTQLALSAALAQRLGGALALDRQAVVATGRWLSVGVLQVHSISPGEGADKPAPEAVTGPQPWVSVLCKFSDVAAEPQPLSYFQNMYGNTYPGLDHYWREVSYDIANVQGSIARGWYVLPHPRSYYVYDMNGDGEPDLDHARAANDCTAVADPDVYYPDYVGVNLMFNADLDCCAWGGSWYMTLDGVSRIWYMTWEPPWGYGNQAVMAHEMGHGFGLPHSSGNYGQTYDNQWDVMSDAWSNCAPHPVYGCLGQHTIAYHKDRLGWIAAGQKFMAGPTSQQITLEQLALPQTGNYRMAQLPIAGSATHFYTVEVRRKVGYDVKLPGQAVIIHEVDTNRQRPAYVLDVDGNGNTGDAGAMWTVGETFHDALNDITVSVDSATATGFVVTVATCTAPAAPADVAISLVGNDLHLDWSDIGVSTYEVWSASDDAYFAPGPDCASAPNCTVAIGSSYVHAGGAFDDSNYYYVVRSVASCGAASGDSNRVGKFPQALQPGS